jgi:D-alanine-D-alanine ligase
MLSEEKIKNLGSIGVLCGGLSAEREISLQSGEAVYNALELLGLDVYKIDVDKTLPKVLEKGLYDRVFNILHGKYGEDGIVQSLLEWYGIPYTGAGVAASAIAMDKNKSKLFSRACGALTPDFMIVRNERQMHTACQTLSYPLVVKPSKEGSSIGISIVKEKNQAIPAYNLARKYGEVMVERFIKGEEYTVGILDNKALPVIKLKAKNEFYDYDAKYVSCDTSYICPCELDKDKEKEMQTIALKIFNTIGCRHWGRADFIMDEKDKIYFIELNTNPGMTEHSLVPMAAKHIGISFENLVLKIIQQTL